MMSLPLILAPHGLMEELDKLRTWQIKGLSLTSEVKVVLALVASSSPHLTWAAPSIKALLISSKLHCNCAIFLEGWIMGFLPFESLFTSKCTSWKFHSQPSSPSVTDFHLFTFIFLNCEYFNEAFKTFLLPWPKLILYSTPFSGHFISPWSIFRSPLNKLLLLFQANEFHRLKDSWGTGCCCFPLSPLAWLKSYL